jgi:predicted phage baseplate assembly protein
LDFADASVSATALMSSEARRLRPAVSLAEEGVGGLWRPRRDLLASRGAAREFVAEVEGDGATYLRFGDDRFGSRPAAGARLTATYRVGGGSAGNVGADSLAHLASNDPAVVNTTPSPILAVSNPLAARGGADPEPLERVRQDAPEAFRTQERAVTTDDYAELARTRCPEARVQRAAATMRWTGSWHTVFVTADRTGGASVDAEFERGLRRCLERYRMAGHDLEVEGPRFVPLEIGMTVCVKRGYLAGDVRRALLEKFSNRTLTGGGRGLFHPDNFSFGQPVFLSALYAAAQSVAGVDSVDINLFQRQGASASDGLAAGRLDFGRLEIARLDNDPDFPERGLFKLDMRGE